ncbi:transcription-repair coupling factor [Actinobacillus equuli]|nr:transcription-repair coupling factor [Actinobacillus equuli]
MATTVFEEMASLFDYLAENTLFITFDGIAEKAEQFHKDTAQRYESRRVDPMRPLLLPDKLWFSVDEVNRGLKLIHV